MSSPIRVAVVDDHPLFLEGLERVINGLHDFELVAVGRTALEACRIVVQTRIDVLLLDIGIPGNGIEALRTITRIAPDVQVVMLTASDDQEHVAESMEIGAKGYVLKGVNGDELLAALRSVLTGKVYVTPGAVTPLLAQSRECDSTEPVSMPTEMLSQREHEILGLVSQGLTNKEISIKTNMPIRTVKHYLSVIFTKLGARSRLEAMLYFRHKN